MAEPLNHPASAPIAEPIDERILAEAAAWLAQLQDGPLPPAEQARLAAWRQQSPQHQRAWQRAERLLGQLNALPAPLAGPALHASTQASRRASLARIAKGTALVLLIAPASWLLWQRQPWQPWQHWRHWMDADYAALPGQNLDLQLDDGSQLSLHAGSQLDVRYSRSQRLLHLRQGELYVHTAADNAQPPRPFIVSTAHGRMQALGTRFAVRQLDGQLDGQPDRQPDAAPGGDGGSTLLAVYEGAVRIEPADAPSAAHRTLRAGQQARFTREAIAPSTTAREADTAWRQGLLIADAMPLPDWAAALARHSGRSIRVLPAAQALRISGTFPLSDPDRALRMLATTLRLRIRQRGQGEGAVVEIG